MSRETMLDCFCATEDLWRRFKSLEGCNTSEQHEKIKRIVSVFDREFPDSGVEKITQAERDTTMAYWHEDGLEEIETA